MKRQLVAVTVPPDHRTTPPPPYPVSRLLAKVQSVNVTPPNTTAMPPPQRDSLPMNVQPLNLSSMARSV